MRKTDTISYQQLLDADTAHDIPAILRESNPGNFQLDPIRADRYVSDEFFKAEVEKVWLKAWLVACREEEIPNPGDTHVFEVVGQSVLLIRQEDRSIRALRNVCLHRGRKLVTQSCNMRRLRCPYHGFTWNVDGSFRECPLPWDFPQIDPENFGLGRIEVDTWAGFVFINFDAVPEPLLEALDPLPRHFERWNIGDCYKAAHVAKLMPANWKAVVEAFLEASHVATTHPQTTPYISDSNTQYDLLGRHIDRFITPVGLPSPQGRFRDSTEEEIFRAMVTTGSRAGLNEPTLPLRAGKSARAYGAELARQRLLAETGYDYAYACDSELLDGISYQVFPNFALWGGMGTKTCYRWRPVAMRADLTLMEVILFKRHPKSGKGKPVPMRLLSDDETWASASELGFLAGVYDQDLANLNPQQEGLRALGAGSIQFGRYTELRCRHLHRLIDEYMSR